MDYKSDQFVEEILNGYNFLGVMERMDESLAVLKLILDLKLSDMLYLSAKTKGSYERFRRNCIKIEETKVTLLMKEYVYSTMFEQFTNPDVLLYRAVNKSLDLTIEELGRDTVDRTVKALRWAQKRVDEKCSGDVVKFPCSKDGRIVEPTCWIRCKVNTLHPTTGLCHAVPPTIGLCTQQLAFAPDYWALHPTRGPFTQLLSFSANY